jgi:hypothetical protein
MEFKKLLLLPGMDSELIDILMTIHKLIRIRCGIINLTAFDFDLYTLFIIIITIKGYTIEISFVNNATVNHTKCCKSDCILFNFR